MEITQYEKRLYGNAVKVISREPNCIQYDMSNETGSAVMTSYDIFPGIQLIYNDVHIHEIAVDTKVPENILEINHCREGRIECEFNRGECLYISKGDLVINLKADIGKRSSFPLNHYHGITIAVDFDRISRPIFQIWGDVKIDLYQLKKKLCGNKSFIIMRENEKIEHIFSELYDVPHEIRQGYFKLKVLEIFLVLSVMEDEDLQKKYYSKKQVDTIKEIRAYLVNHLEQKITIEQLSAQFKIPTTTMKLIFKGVYGSSIYAFIKGYKMQKAALLLRETNIEIGEIAMKMGYDNASKFSEAFKKTMGCTPRNYRNDSK